jgi:hypothetical protein
MPQGTGLALFVFDPSPAACPDIQRGLDPAMPQNFLHRLRLNLRLVHHPVGKRMAEIMQPKPMPFWNLHTGPNSSLAQVIPKKHSGRKRNLPIRPEGRKHKISVLSVRRPGTPGFQMTPRPEWNGIDLPELYTIGLIWVRPSSIWLA